MECGGSHHSVKDPEHTDSSLEGQVPSTGRVSGSTTPLHTSHVQSTSSGARTSCSRMVNREDADVSRKRRMVLWGSMAIPGATLPGFDSGPAGDSGHATNALWALSQDL